MAQAQKAPRTVSQFHMMLTHFQVDHTSGSRGWVESTRPCFEETSAEIVKQIQLDMSRQHDDLGQTHSRPPTDQMLGWGFSPTKHVTHVKYGKT